MLISECSGQLYFHPLPGTDSRETYAFSSATTLEECVETCFVKNDFCYSAIYDPQLDQSIRCQLSYVGSPYCKQNLTTHYAVTYEPVTIDCIWCIQIRGNESTTSSLPVSAIRPKGEMIEASSPDVHLSTTVMTETQKPFRTFPYNSRATRFKVTEATAAATTAAILPTRHTGTAITSTLGQQRQATTSRVSSIETRTRPMPSTATTQKFQAKAAVSSSSSSLTMITVPTTTTTAASSIADASFTRSSQMPSRSTASILQIDQDGSGALPERQEWPKTLSAERHHHKPETTVIDGSGVYPVSFAKAHVGRTYQRMTTPLMFETFGANSIAREESPDADTSEDA
ncbi:unnamed protein product [Soboliphyme baturini]|uniref:Apple domain-containing protein n=1 Tax=Soboliphyme baturini TaxID=241478 RepID=A0A183ITM5_9BILA|nr:unnamed protein product [Soboliphyme baturini]